LKQLSADDTVYEEVGAID